MNGYFGYIVSVVSPALAPFLNGSASIPVMQEPPSLLETAIELNSNRHSHSNGYSQAYNPQATQPYRRELILRREPEKKTANHAQSWHGYTTPRAAYRKVAEHK